MPRDILTVKEFDIITDNEDYKNSRSFRFLKKKYFDEFKAFVRKNSPDEESTEYGALDFFKSYTKKGIGEVIQARNYVGLIQMESGFQIQVLPKIDLIDDKEQENSTSRIFIKMLCSMKDFPGKVFNLANVRTENIYLFEVFIQMYAQKVLKLAKQGLQSAYMTVENNEKFFKGKLLINEHIKQNFAHHERFFVSYDLFQANRPENRLIKSTLINLQGRSNYHENIKTIKQILTYFEFVEPSSNYDKDFSQVVIDKNTSDYKEIILWSKVFLKNKSFSSFSGDTSALALLFPMEKVFESYVARNMTYNFSDFGWEVFSQDHSYHLFKENGRNVFALRPDIVVRTNTNHLYVMDTKWKRLNNDSYLNYGISQLDMYQMYAYSKRYKTQTWLIYPITDKIRNNRRIIFRSTENFDNAIVNVFFINLANINESLKILKNQIEEIERQYSL